MIFVYHFLIISQDTYFKSSRAKKIIITHSSNYWSN